MRTVGILLWQLGLPLVAFAETAATPSTPHSDLLTSVGLCFGIAAILAVLASKFKQPSILAYLAAGVLIGPEIGLGWITDQQAIEVIAEVGLLLLLFIIGLEIDLKNFGPQGDPCWSSDSCNFSSAPDSAWYFSPSSASAGDRRRPGADGWG